MAARRRKVIWTVQARTLLDEAVTYIAEDSMEAALKLLTEALDAAESLATLSERGRKVPEINEPNTRELFVQSYRLIYEVHESEVHVLAFLHGVRDFQTWRRESEQGED